MPNACPTLATPVAPLRRRPPVLPSAAFACRGIPRPSPNHPFHDAGAFRGVVHRR